MRKISYYDLGATLYIPMNHGNVLPILNREKFTNIRSIVLCLEDSVSSVNFPAAMNFLRTILEESPFKVSDLKVFIRPRNLNNLKEILKLKNISLIDGFSIPKFDTKNASEYLSVFIKENSFYFMPILETKDVFSSISLTKIATELEPFKDRILTVRVGSEDILSLLNMMREREKTIYEIMPLYLIFSTIINLFKSNNFEVSSPVYSCFGSPDILKRELDGDIEHQIFNKTIIHPEQASIIHNAYKVKEEDYLIAKKLIDGDLEVFGFNGRMYEKKTHTNWAKSIVKRAEIYSLKRESDQNE